MMEKFRISRGSVTKGSGGLRGPLLKISEGLIESVREVHLRPPFQNFGGARRRNYRATLLAWTGGRVLRRPGHIRDGSQCVIKIVHAGLDTSADVNRAGDIAARRGGIRTHYIADKNIVAGLFAVAENRARFAFQHSPTEDRNHTSFAMRVLTRTINIPIAKRRVIDPVLNFVEKQIGLGRELDRKST